MAQTIIRPPEAFSLSTARKRPRQTSEAHLKAIRFLGCVICLSHPVEAAHIRAPSLQHGKRETGKGERPSDKFAVPLCNKHHRQQHGMNELAFWDRYGVNPFGTALALWGADGDEEAMAVIVRAARKRT